MVAGVWTMRTKTEMRMKMCAQRPNRQVGMKWCLVPGEGKRRANLGDVTVFPFYLLFGFLRFQLFRANCD
jgi:hypothetical protein